MSWMVCAQVWYDRALQTSNDEGTNMALHDLMSLERVMGQVWFHLHARCRNIVEFDRVPVHSFIQCLCSYPAVNHTLRLTPPAQYYYC